MAKEKPAPIIQNCRLCGQKRPMVESHLWPKFVYRRYVTDQSLGGRFFDVKKGDLEGKQFTYPWFCAPCDNEVLSRTENSAARLCAAIHKNPDTDQPYDGGLLGFAASISLRTTLLHLELTKSEPTDEMRAACRHWRHYLLHKRASVGAHTQQVFLVFDKQHGLHEMAGGNVFRDLGLVVSQIGALKIVGLFGCAQRGIADGRAWRASELSHRRGTLAPIKEWRVGGDSPNITADLTTLLVEHERRLVQRITEIFQKQDGENPPDTPPGPSPRAERD